MSWLSLFYAVINDLSKVIQNCAVAMYADNTRLYLPGTSLAQLNEVIHSSQVKNQSNPNHASQKSKLIQIRKREHAEIELTETKKRLCRMLKMLVYASQCMFRKLALKT